MNRTRTITLELLLADQSLSGRARDEVGASREFSGRLGLMRTIDELLARPSVAGDEAAALSRLIGGEALGPDDDGWDERRRTFNLTLDQRPALVAVPASREEVATVVNFAREAGLRVAPQRTGHNAAPLGSLERTVLLKTDRLDRVHVDPVARRARVGAGARWEDVVPLASEHGLAALHGSTPDVSVAGYSLGGGIGWYARKHGLAANSVTAIELVSADGAIRQVDADHQPELFWALRGGGGNFGVVTALEFELFPAAAVYAGALFFPFERAAEVLQAWRVWTAGAPEEVTSVGRLLRLPPLPEIPEPLRGGAFALVEAVFLGGRDEGEALLAPLRGLGPALDTFAMVPPAGIAELHMDPREPLPYAGDHTLTGPIDAAAIEALVAAAGPGSGSTLVSVELRQMGGALARAAAGAGAAAAMPGEFISYAVGLAADPETTAATEADLARVAAALAPYESGRYFNFVERTAAAESFFDPATAARLLDARQTYDPTHLFQANHELGAGR